MKKIRKACERGHLNFGWLDAKHTFSFGSYLDPAQMGFKTLRVINNDIVAEGKGFETHPHKDMEIITFIICGEIEHRDTLGNITRIKPGEIQVMSAGTGVFHSEFNPRDDQKTEMYQIWIKPKVHGVKPHYDQFNYTSRIIENDFIELVAPIKKDQVALINQDARLLFGKFSKDGVKNLKLDQSKSYWLQVVSGSLSVDNTLLERADGLAVENEKDLNITSLEKSEVLLFELA